MDRGIERLVKLAALRAAATLASLLLAGAAITSTVAAQTLTAPNSTTNWTAPQRDAKSRAEARAKSCAKFGPGFVNVPGTDGCIKIGGWVTIEGTARR